MTIEPQADSERVEERSRMVQEQLRARAIRDERVLEAFYRIPRHEFVAPGYRPQAYEDHPLPIGDEQTVSQPYIIARSLEALELKGEERVLEIGTGSGYQTALLALLARQVYSIERHARLVDGARAVLSGMGLKNVEVLVGDGSRGLPEHAPYAAILVSAAAPGLPASLLAQLAENGRMVIPVGPAHVQELQLVRKLEGNHAISVLEGCRFVPLVGAEGY